MFKDIEWSKNDIHLRVFTISTLVLLKALGLTIWSYL